MPQGIRRVLKPFRFLRRRPGRTWRMATASGIAPVSRLREAGAVVVRTAKAVASDEAEGRRLKATAPRAEALRAEAGAAAATTAHPDAVAAGVRTNRNA